MSDLAAVYRRSLLDDVVPFWLRHGMDGEHGGIMTCLDRDGSVLDTDKSVWFQGRAGWMFATLFNTVERRPEWLEAARSCVDFSRRHCFSPSGKMWFSVTREGRPLRMRRYVFSEAFAAISFAAYAKAAGDGRAADEARQCFEAYLRHSFEPGVMPPKFETATRPMKGIGPLMIGIVTAQELREHLGDEVIRGRSCSEWIDAFIAEIERDFLKPDHEALMETVAPDGGIIDHLDGRTLNPGHAIECAWFIMQEGRLRGERRLVELGRTILDWMWRRGWDEEHGGLFYFRDLHGKPVQEYWHEMKFWWPHCEAIIATLLAWKLTGSARHAEMHRLVHDWSFAHFPDHEHGEWFGYLRRDGTVSQPAKGNLFKGPFHLPRMLWFCWRLMACCFALCLLPSCGQEEPGITGEVLASRKAGIRQEARAMLLDPQNALLGSADHVIKDEALIEPALDRIMANLESWLDGDAKRLRRPFLTPRRTNRHADSSDMSASFCIRATNMTPRKLE